MNMILANFTNIEERRSLVFWQNVSLKMAKKSLEYYKEYDDDIFKNHAREFIRQANVFKKLQKDL